MCGGSFTIHGIRIDCPTSDLIRVFLFYLFIYLFILRVRSLVALGNKAEDTVQMIPREGWVGDQHIILGTTASSFDLVEVLIPVGSWMAEGPQHSQHTLCSWCEPANINPLRPRLCDSGVPGMYG